MPFDLSLQGYESLAYAAGKTGRDRGGKYKCAESGEALSTHSFVIMNNNDNNNNSGLYTGYVCHLFSERPLSFTFLDSPISLR